MKTCQHCDHQNPKHRQLCLQCGKLIKKESKLSQIASGIMWVIGGIVLIATDSNFDLAIFKFIPIPFGLSILGISTIVYGAGQIFSIKINLPRKAKSPGAVRGIENEGEIKNVISPKKTPSLLPIKKIPTGHRDWITCSHCDTKQMKNSVTCNNCGSEFEK